MSEDTKDQTPDQIEALRAGVREYLATCGTEATPETVAAIEDNLSRFMLFSMDIYALMAKHGPHFTHAAAMLHAVTLLGLDKQPAFVQQEIQAVIRAFKIVQETEKRLGSSNQIDSPPAA